MRAHPVAASLLAGFAATQIATIVGYFLPGIGIPSLNWPATNGFLVVPTASQGAQFAAGAFVHHIDGIVFALLYAVLFYDKVRLPNTTLGNVGKATIYSIILGIISAGFLVPYVYFPRTGADIFSFGYDELAQPSPLTNLFVDVGWKLPLAILIWHLAYGLVLGLLFDPSEDRPTETSTTA